MLSLSLSADVRSLSLNPIWRARVLSGAGSMTKEFAHYRQLERRLWMARWMREGRECSGEHATLDEMEDTWFHLSDEEQDLLRSEPPRCWPTESSSLPPELPDRPYLAAPALWAYEGFHSPVEAILSAEAA
jgi:hypothetical protein